MEQQQLSGIDASFLYLETPETPMHVAGLTYFELPPGFEGSFYQHFRRFFESRLHTIPIFSKRLAPSLYDLDHPGWVHHAAVDGGAGMAINKALYDVTATPREVPPPAPKSSQPGAAPSSPTAVDPVKGISDIMGNMMRQQLRMWQTASEIGTAMTNAFLAKPGEAGPKALATLQSLVNQLPTLNAPKTPFNATITRERSYAARTVSLSDAKAIAKASGTKLNDVVMAICAGALRRYLQEKGQLPDKPLIAGVPISLREPGDTRQNNQVSGMLCSIATDIADPVERLKAILKSSSESKQIAGTFRDAVPQDFAFVGAPILLQLIMLVYGRSGLADKLPMPMNVTISNVPGPPMPLYCAGAKVTALHPVSIPAHGAALNITVQSYMDALNFGLTADRRAVPDVGKLGDYMVAAANELKAAVVPA
jgi:WS/DGAT/MGAT family acyltransferase